MFLRVALVTLVLVVAICVGAPPSVSDPNLEPALTAAGADLNEYSCDCHQEPGNEGMTTHICHCTKKGSETSGTDQGSQSETGRVRVTCPSTSSDKAESGKMQQCYGNQTEFADACQKVLGGVADGARCFFHGGADKSWSAAWKVCAEHGAQLAQIHSDIEYDKVLEYMKAKIGPTLPGEVRVAMMNPPTVKRHDNCMIDPDNSVWYDSENEPNKKLIAGKTWLRNYLCGDDTVQNVPLPTCITLWQKKGSNIYSFGDDVCAYGFHALCQYNNGAQEFNQTEFCLTEDPIETSETSDPQECATLCAKRGWCRSYNVVTGKKTTCQLFPWSIYDTCPKCAKRTAATATCTHYNYIS